MTGRRAEEMQKDVVELDRMRKPTPEAEAEAMQQLGNPVRLQALITGKMKPPNEYVAFIVEQVRGARIERDQLKTEIERGENLLGMLRKKLIATEAIHDRYVADLKEWDKPEKKG